MKRLTKLQVRNDPELQKIRQKIAKKKARKQDFSDLLAEYNQIEEFKRRLRNEIQRKKISNRP